MRQPDKEIKRSSYLETRNKVEEAVKLMKESVGNKGFSDVEVYSASLNLTQSFIEDVSNNKDAQSLAVVLNDLDRWVKWLTDISVGKYPDLRERIERLRDVRAGGT